MCILQKIIIFTTIKGKEQKFKAIKARTKHNFLTIYLLVSKIIYSLT